MKNNFESNYVLDFKKYREFSKGYMRYNKKLTIIIIIAILIYILNLISKNYGGLVLCFFTFLIFFIVFKLMGKSQIQYRRMLVSNNGREVNNTVKINDEGILIINNNTDNDNRYSFNQIIGIIETTNLLILKMNYNLGIIIDKNNLNGGTKEELISYLLVNCHNLKSKRIVMAGKINIFDFLIVGFLLITFILSIILYFLDNNFLFDIKRELQFNDYIVTKSYSTSNYDLYSISKKMEYFTAYIYEYDKEENALIEFNNSLIFDDDISINCDLKTDKYQKCTLENDKYIIYYIINNRYVFYGMIDKLYVNQLREMLEKINYLK